MIITYAMFLTTFKRLKADGVSKDEVFDVLDIQSDQDYDPNDLDRAFAEVYSDLS
jgi:hypothetical protein